MADDIAVKKSGGDPLPPKPAGIEDLLDKATRGDRSCLPELRTLLTDPKQGRLLQVYGSPPAWLEGKLVKDASGKNLAVEEASTLELARVRKELEGPDPTPAERLLAERAAICWWLVSRYEWIYASSEGLSIKQAEFHQGLIDRVHNRFLSALRTLATVRKLALPALQINLARQQVNVAGGSA